MGSAAWVTERFFWSLSGNSYQGFIAADVRLAATRDVTPMKPGRCYSA